MIEIYINKADARASEFETLTTGMLNAVHVHFNFSEHWDGLSKVAVFTNGLRSVNVMEASWQDDSCPIPQEVLQAPWRVVRCGVYGMRGEQMILPAIMVGLGRVRPGTDPNGDPGTDPDLPIWQQLDNRVADLEASARIAERELCYTELVKNYYARGSSIIRDGEMILRVNIHGLTSLDGCPELRVYNCVRRRQRRYQWRNPGNWDDNTSIGRTKMVYGLIAGRYYAQDDSEPVYPDVPAWMPNDGFLQTVFPIDAATLAQGYIEIDLRRWVLPLLKPIDHSLNWRALGMMALQKESEKVPLLFQFRICRDGQDIGQCRNTLALGLRNGSSTIASAPGFQGFFDDSGRLRAGFLYASIR